MGVLVDDGLRFKDHIKYRAEKGRRLCGALCSLGNTVKGMSPKAWRQLYTGMVRPVLTWGMEVAWRGEKKAIEDMEKVE